MGFDKPIKNKQIYDLNRNKNPPFQGDQAEISTDWMRVVIHLSNERYVSTVKRSLSEALLDSEIEVQGNKITVSTYPPEANFDEDSVLAIAQKHDPLAERI